MTLVDLGSTESGFRFALGEDSGEFYVSRYSSLDSWSGCPLYWFVYTDAFSPPLEFMFGEDGRFASSTVLIAGNLEMCENPPAPVSSPTETLFLPRVDISPWKKADTTVIDERTRVRAWWDKENFWVVKAGALPAAYFDTGSGMMVVFDDRRAFVGLVVQSLGCQRNEVDRVIRIKDVKG